MQPYTPDEARKLLDALKADRLTALYSAALAVGLRLGEALGGSGVRTSISSPAP
jgi:hypothetical protein